MNDEEKIAQELKNLYNSWDDDCLNEGLESLPYYSNLRPEKCRYSSEEIIAEGGMKTISKMFDPKVGRNVAMASLHADAPKELYEPFLREAYLTSQLDHPNIITIFDIFLDEYLRPRFTMELKTGQTFKEIIAKAHQDKYPSSNEQNQLLDIFLKICDAMNYAHDKGVVHLDLKPENVQVGQHGEVIVCDWGIGKVLSDSDSHDHDFDNLLLNPDLINNMTMQGKIKGTPGYMAPEQAEEKEKSQQTDIYALGAILYTIVTGKMPVEGRTLDDVLKNTVDGNIIQPEEFVHSKSPALCSIARKALSLKPEDRFKSVSQMQEDVRKVITGFSPSTEEFGFIKELKLLYLRNKLVSNICLIFIVVLSLAISLSVDLLQISENKALKAKEKLQEEVALKIKIGKDAAPGHAKKVLEFLSTGQYALALKHAKTAVELDDSNRQSHNMLGLLYFIHGQYSEALQSFQEPEDLVFISLQKLSALYMKNDYDPKEEEKYVKGLLSVCNLVSSDERTTALLLHWLQHENKKFRQYALELFRIPLVHTEYVLKYTASLTDQELKRTLLNKIIGFLYYHRHWPKRRASVELAISLTKNEKLKQWMASILPDNLAMGQNVKVTGTSVSGPESAIDGDNRTSSCWSTSSRHGSIEVDIAKVEKISEIRILFKQDFKKSFLYQYIIEISTDGKNFTKLIDNSKTTERRASWVHHFKPTPARFVRVSVESEFGVHIVELTVLKPKIK